MHFPSLHKSQLTDAQTVMPWASRRMCLTFTRLFMLLQKPSVHCIKTLFFLRAIICVLTLSHQLNFTLSDILAAITKCSHVYTREHLCSHNIWIHKFRASLYINSSRRRVIQWASPNDNEGGGRFSGSHHSHSSVR